MPQFHQMTDSDQRKIYRIRIAQAGQDIRDKLSTIGPAIERVHTLGLFGRAVIKHDIVNWLVQAQAQL